MADACTACRRVHSRPRNPSGSSLPAHQLLQRNGHVSCLPSTAAHIDPYAQTIEGTRTGSHPGVFSGWKQVHLMAAPTTPDSRLLVTPCYGARGSRAALAAASGGRARGRSRAGCTAAGAAARRVIAERLQALRSSCSTHHRSQTTARAAGAALLWLSGLRAQQNASPQTRAGRQLFDTSLRLPDRPSDRPLASHQARGPRCSAPRRGTWGG